MKVSEDFNMNQEETGFPLLWTKLGSYKIAYSQSLLYNVLRHPLERHSLVLLRTPLIKCSLRKGFNNIKGQARQNVNLTIY